MDFTVKPFCGYYAICQNGEPLLICQGLTTAQTIVKLMEKDIKGEVHPLCYMEI